MKDDVNTMKKTGRSVFVTLMLLATAFLLCACSGDPTPYDNNNAAGYTVSVRYDANGGVFATNTTIIMDSYNISGMTPGSNGMVSLGLLAPEDAARGSSDNFLATKEGYFLAGWYTERTESTDSEGNTVYTYGKKWDFSTDLLDVDPSKTYTSSEPVLTLYAAWIPEFEINFIALGTDEVLGTYTYDPLTNDPLLVPQWDTKTGAMEMHRFPEKDGYTFCGAYYDVEGTRPVTETVVHSGKILENGTAQGHSMNVYVDYMEGEWFQIYTAEQLRKNASPSGHYVLMADLDFTDVKWPSDKFATASFSGSIHGNGYTIKNVTLEQTKMDVQNTGLFGTLQPGSVIEDVTFENVTFIIKKGFQVSANYGLFAGSIYEGALIRNVQIKASQLQIDSSARFATDDYAIGLVCGAGKADQLAGAEITASMTGNDPEKYTITVGEDGNELILTAKDTP